MAAAAMMDWSNSLFAHFEENPLTVLGLLLVVALALKSWKDSAAAAGGSPAAVALSWPQEAAKMKFLMRLEKANRLNAQQAEELKRLRGDKRAPAEHEGQGQQEPEGEQQEPEQQQELNCSVCGLGHYAADCPEREPTLPAGLPPLPAGIIIPKLPQFQLKAKAKPTNAKKKKPRGRSQSPATAPPPAISPAKQSLGPVECMSVWNCPLCGKESSSVLASTAKRWIDSEKRCPKCPAFPATGHFGGRHQVTPTHHHHHHHADPYHAP